ncbi:MAG: hypothetical protein KIS92_26520, partial [Planctomycetota bacterium]|nr:hypothetical protein [Planctomycetota bacterium]
MPAAPPYYLLGLAVMGGIALSGAAWFGFYSLESPRRRVAASFCAVNAAYALYVLFQALVCSAASLESAALLLKGQAAAAGGLFVGLVWLDAAFPERRWGGIDWA